MQKLESHGNESVPEEQLERDFNLLLNLLKKGIQNPEETYQIDGYQIQFSFTNENGGVTKATIKKPDGSVHQLISQEDGVKSVIHAPLDENGNTKSPVKAVDFTNQNGEKFSSPYKDELTKTLLKLADRQATIDSVAEKEGFVSRLAGDVNTRIKRILRIK